VNPAPFVEGPTENKELFVHRTIKALITNLMSLTSLHGMREVISCGVVYGVLLNDDNPQTYDLSYYW